VYKRETAKDVAGARMSLILQALAEGPALSITKENYLGNEGWRPVQWM
jgi:hypothetical protein